VRPWPIRQPINVDGHPVTFWAEIPGPRRRASIADLGTALRQLHAVEDGQLQEDLMPLDPWARTPGRIEQAPIRDRDRRVLRDVLAEVQDAWPLAQFELPGGTIHGDAHAGNLIQSPAGAPLLLDFDSACIGPREWDLAPTALYAVSLGWISRSDYAGFVDAYGGFDVTAAAAFPLLTRMRELRMTAWIAMHASESERLAAEVEHRVACLADPELPRHWSAR
jgi:Ser/Thr protein kinase RdoA (MazF antagonist)